jgi:hypothetical protein
MFLGNVGDFFGAYLNDKSDYIAKLRYHPTDLGDIDHPSNFLTSESLGAEMYIFKNSHVERYSRYCSAVAARAGRAHSLTKKPPCLQAVPPRACRFGRVESVHLG